MAKKTPAVEAPAEEALVKTQSQALEPAPDFLQDDRTGTENIGQDDIQMPRLAVAQQMSPQIDEEKDNFIEGLKKGELFNSVSEKIYGKGPVKFIILRSDKPRYVEFIPRTEGGGIRDFNVPANDPRTKFGADGKPPIATKFYDFIVMLPDYDNELIGLSFKGTSIRTAKLLNTMVLARKKAIYAGVYTVTTASKSNAKGTFYIYEVQNAGWVSHDQFVEAKKLHEALSGKEVKFDREPGADDGDGDGFPHGDNEETKGM
jgi:hypothetical protein